EVRKNFDFGKWKKLSEKSPITDCGCQISILHGEINLDAEEYLKQVKPITVDKNGGYILVAANKKLLEGECMRYTTLAWRSFKLDRVCRSSLSTETQACATATDELMITKLFYSLMLDPDQDLRSGKTVKKAGQSAVVIDARALYDATKRDTIKNAVDKRAAVEILRIKEALEFTGSEIRQSLVDALGGGYIQLVVRGSAVANYVKAMIMANAPKCAEGKPAEDDDDFDWFVIYGGIMVVVMTSVFVTILVMKLVKAEKKSMREMETQTERWELDNVKSENVFLKGRC
ncbi:unnamed protein product, partial [Effrenium voratum]